jgi:pimeloyl-ACP methyl ester carboxylesterase
VFTRLARQCLADDPLTRTVGTVDTARDLDRIRQALGVERLDYYGLSYGTELGAVYATRFPSHAGAMVLDGAVDPLLSLGAVATEEAPAIDAALDRFFTTCVADPTCPLRPDPKALYDGLLARLAKAPLGAEAVSNDLAGCVAWPKGDAPVTAVHGAPTPALVIGNAIDPNTPHLAAVQLARALGSARLVTWQGVGHTWLLNGNDDPCIQAVVTAYLVDGRLPPTGTTCP